MLDQHNFFTFNQYREYRLVENEIALRYAKLRQFGLGLDTETKNPYASTEPEISPAPDLSDIAPFSRIKLVSLWMGSHIKPGLEEVWAVVVSVEGSRVEAYIFQTDDLRHGRISVEISQVIDCFPPLKSGEFESDTTLKTESTRETVTKQQFESVDDFPF